MKMKNILCGFILGLLWLGGAVANAGIIESGDLNIIDDAGNASVGLRYLDMIYIDGKTEAAALAATPSEFDDLFSAAGIAYDGALTASGPFTVVTN